MDWSPRSRRSSEAATRSATTTATAHVRGCRKKPLEKTRSTLAEVHLRAVVHDALASDRLRATHEIAIFGTHPYRRSSGLARGFPDSHVQEEQPRPRTTCSLLSKSDARSAATPTPARRGRGGARVRLLASSRCGEGPRREPCSSVRPGAASGPA